MPSMTLFQDEVHRNILLEDFGHGEEVQANQHLIVHNGAGMILDPGGHQAFPNVIAQTTNLLEDDRLRYVFLSHQDPDVVSAMNGWLMGTEADAYISALWMRFIPHFGIDDVVVHRLKPIPDEGTVLDLGGAELMVLPAHFLHSCGNFHVYDPIAKILYSGDLGASLGLEETVVTDFDEHLKYMEGFHRRYMASNRALRSWVATARELDIETIAPQHGALFKGKEMVHRFLEWCDGLSCGIDLMADCYRVPC